MKNKNNIEIIDFDDFCDLMFRVIFVSLFMLVVCWLAVVANQFPLINNSYLLSAFLCLLAIIIGCIGFVLLLLFVIISFECFCYFIYSIKYKPQKSFKEWFVEGFNDLKSFFKEWF